MLTANVIDVNVLTFLQLFFADCIEANVFMPPPIQQIGPDI